MNVFVLGVRLPINKTSFETRLAPSTLEQKQLEMFTLYSGVHTVYRVYRFVQLGSNSMPDMHSMTSPWYSGKHKVESVSVLISSEQSPVFQIWNILNTMAHCELDSVVTKFKHLWHAGSKASRKAVDGQASVVLSAGLGNIPPPIHAFGPHGLPPRHYGDQHTIAGKNGDEQLEKMLTKFLPILKKKQRLYRL
jgi:hypothetical protein